MIDTVAIYIRLSLEDGDLCSGGKEESESITNQRKLLTEYVRASPELCYAKLLEFCDDGYSGKNFCSPFSVCGSSQSMTILTAPARETLTVWTRPF